MRRAFNDPAGFVTGWVLFLDYLIVIALAALFVPHYLGAALGWDALRDSPWDVVVGVRRDRRRSPPCGSCGGPGSTGRGRRRRARPRAQLLLVVLGFALALLAATRSRAGLDLGTAPTLASIAFALPLAMLAYTGLETVANLAAETREPGRTLPRSLFVGIGLVVVMTRRDRGASASSAYPGATDGDDGARHDWLRGAAGRHRRRRSTARCPAASVDVAAGLRRHHRRADPARRGRRPSISGVGRLAYSLGRARHAAARLRPPRARGAHRARVDRRRRGDRDRRPR